MRTVQCKCLARQVCFVICGRMGSVLAVLAKTSACVDDVMTGHLAQQHQEQRDTLRYHEVAILELELQLKELSQWNTRGR